MPTRPSAVAGTWYPGSAGALAREIDALLDAAGPPLGGRVTAVLAPHAGLMFSGPVAAYAYKTAAAAGPYDAIVLLGPSHFVGFDGVAVFADGVFETPLGPARIDAGLAKALLDRSSVMHEDADSHRREHSLEMQLPFIRRLLPDVPIVPLLMGSQTRATIRATSDALSGVLKGRRALLVASSDLSHYFDAPTAVRLDARVSDCVTAFDAARLQDLFEEYPDGERGRYVACGGGPAISVMRAAGVLGAGAGRVLKYAHSGHVSGDDSGVVGYLAAAFGVFDDEH